MTRNVRIKNGIVVEVVPSFIENPSKYYNEEAGTIVATENENVSVGWLYDATNSTFCPENEHAPEPSAMDILEAQVMYTAMMTDTLIGG